MSQRLIIIEMTNSKRFLARVVVFFLAIFHSLFVLLMLLSLCWCSFRIITVIFFLSASFCFSRPNSKLQRLFCHMLVLPEPNSTDHYGNKTANQNNKANQKWVDVKTIKVKFLLMEFQFRFGRLLNPNTFAAFTSKTIKLCMNDLCVDTIAIDWFVYTVDTVFVCCCQRSNNDKLPNSV